MSLQKSLHNLVGDELLIAVFHSFPKKQNLHFKDENNVMYAFFNASREDKYADLFKNYHFDVDGIKPYSKEIADGINNLHQSSLMSKMNPSFSYHVLSDGIDIRYNKFIKGNLNKEQIRLIGQLAHDIKKELI